MRLLVPSLLLFFSFYWSVWLGPRQFTENFIGQGVELEFNYPSNPYGIFHKPESRQAFSGYYGRGEWEYPVTGWRWTEGKTIFYQFDAAAQRFVASRSTLERCGSLNYTRLTPSSALQSEKLTALQCL